MDGNTMNNKGLSQAFETASKKTLSIDVARYQHLLDNEGLSDDEKLKVLEAMWMLITAFVDLGYEVHPVQEVCGKAEKLTDEWDKSGTSQLDSKHVKFDDDQENAPGES